MRNSRVWIRRSWVVVAAAFYACGGRGVDRPPTIEAYGLTVEGERLGNSLNVLNYSDYIAPALVERFEQEYHVDVIVDFFDHNDAMIAKLLAGGIGQYDVVIAADYAVQILAGRQLLQPLDHSNLPNLANINPRFLNLPFDPGNTYSAPYQWGTTGLGIRVDRVDTTRALDTWALVFDSAASLGPFTMLDEPRETIGAALKYLGHSVNSRDPKELEAAQNLLTQQRRRVLAYASATGGRDLLASADAVVVHGYNGDIVLTKDEVPDIVFVVPREGSIVWTDNMTVPVRAPNRYTAEVFINFVLAAEHGAALTNYTRFASPNAAALPHIEPAIRRDPALFPPEEVLERLEILEELGEARALYDRVWTRVVAGGRGN